MKNLKSNQPNYFNKKLNFFTHIKQRLMKESPSTRYSAIKIYNQRKIILNCRSPITFDTDKNFELKDNTLVSEPKKLNAKNVLVVAISKQGIIFEDDDKQLYLVKKDFGKFPIYLLSKTVNIIKKENQEPIIQTQTQSRARI